jgi:hypothetical protein
MIGAVESVQTTFHCTMCCADQLSIAVQTNFPVHQVSLSIALVRLSTARLRDSTARVGLSIALASYCTGFRPVQKSDTNSSIIAQKGILSAELEPRQGMPFQV